MQAKGAVGRIYSVCDWVMKLAYINFLWILFSLVGFVIAGVAPATVALFVVTRKWLLQETDIPVFKTFLDTYKKEFLQANKLGLILVVSALFLYYDFRILANVGGTTQYILFIPLLLINVFFIITLLYVFPVYVHFELKLIQYFKNSFYIAIINMHFTIFLIASLVLLRLLFSYIPGLIPFFSASLIALLCMWWTLRGFRRIEEKQNSDGMIHHKIC